MDNSQKYQQKYKQLNEGQKAAVDNISGPVLVVAGPGTGKTQVLAMRIAGILANPDSGASASNILCLTFTEAGVTAMRSRLRDIIGAEAYKVNIHTFHSFSNEVIQTFPEKFPQFSGNPQQLDDLNKTKLLREVLDSLGSDEKLELRPFHNPYFYEREIANNITTLKREGVSVDEFVQIAQEELAELEANPDINPKTGKPKGKYAKDLKIATRNVELSQIYKKFAAAIDQHNFYDYEDMILFVIKAFSKNEDLLGDYAERFLYIHVDEYQDTNGSQNKLIKLLGSIDPDNQPNIFAVGDDDQAIYRFQGANVENLLFFERQFDNVKTIPITTNYRSSQAILDFASDSISHNQNRLVNIIPGLTKELVAGTSSRNVVPQIVELDNGEQEIDFVLTQVQQLQSNGVSLDEIAILYRRHSDITEFADNFLQAGIPIRMTVGNNVLDDVLVKQFINILKLINQPPSEADQLLTEVLFYKFLLDNYKIERLEVFKLINQYSQANYFEKNYNNLVPMMQTLSEMEESHGLRSFHDQIVNWRAESENMNLAELLVNVIQESGLFTYIFGGEVDVDQANNINQIVKFARNQQYLDSDTSLGEFLNDIYLIKEQKISIGSGKIELDEHALNLLTAHSSKGLEFEHVFIIKAYHKNWGGRATRSSIHLPPQVFDLSDDMADADELKAAVKDQELEDERRLFFVAATRAKSGLYVTSAKQYTNDGNTKEVEQSQFINELNPDLFETLELDITSGQTTKRLERQLSAIQLAPLNEQEQKYLRKLLEKFRLSASALNEYIECPLKFKFNRLLHAPYPPSQYIALGNAVHKAMENWGRAVMSGKISTSLEDMKQKVLADFNTALRKELLGREDYELTKIEGESILNSYIDFYFANGVDQEIAAVEYNFGKHNVVLEMEGAEPIVLSGKIDKLEWVDKAQNRVKIIDYKTSSYKSENAIRGNTKYSDKNIWRQLVFYKLLAELDNQFAPATKIGKYVIDHVEVDFVKPDGGKHKKVAIQIENQDVEEVKLEIKDVMLNIRDLNFHGNEDYPLCGECDYCQLLVS